MVSHYHICQDDYMFNILTQFNNQFSSAIKNAFIIIFSSATITHLYY